MSRRVKAAIAASLAVVVIAAGVWAWFLSQQGLGDASAWSGVLQGFAALLSIPTLLLGVLALRAPSDAKMSSLEDSTPRSQRVSIGRIKAGGSVDINVRQDQAPQADDKKHAQ
jgi:hypothetical protein